MASSEPYEITVLGATGWTATICAEHIAKTFPTTTRWCIAGRSADKLERLRQSLRAINPDRLEPAIHIIPRLDAESLDPLVGNTKVLINGIGPYHRYGTPVVESCARNGTHYVDFSTETAWIADMIRGYHSLAEQSGAIIIPAISGSSSPSDLVAWLLVTHLHDHGLPGPSEVVCSGKLNMLGMQGGSLHTVLDVAEHCGIGGWLKGDSWILSQAPKPLKTPPIGLLGHRYDPVLGHLGTSFVAWGNQSVVQRSASFDARTYGRDFVFREYIPTSGFFSAAIVHIITKLGVILLCIPWFRSFVRGKAFHPGSGPDREESRKVESAEWKATAYIKGNKEPTAVAEFGYKGALVDMAAILAVEAAATIMEMPKAKGDGSPIVGLLTPSILGVRFVDRLKKTKFTLGVHGV
ncbi:Sacchrp-dh-NADP domain-containing protein [Fusarium sp. LHS14.1]|nr:Sacchrp-dh-NADP domain-containing protein [Fusarium sp. LHS14.1]